MKAEVLKRLFRAIASSDTEAIGKLTHIVIEEERSKGHTLLADQLENITKKSQKDKSTSTSKLASSVLENVQDGTCFNGGNLRNAVPPLSELPTSKRFNLPLVTVIPREKLRHHMVLPENVEGSIGVSGS